jgi:hypothetical protein
MASSEKASHKIHIERMAVTTVSIRAGAGFLRPKMLKVSETKAIARQLVFIKPEIA